MPGLCGIGDCRHAVPWGTRGAGQVVSQLARAGRQRVPVGDGPGGAWHCPSHRLAAKMVAVASLPDRDICLQPFQLAVTRKALATDEQGDGRGVG